jgi:hypothetical protein
LRTSPTGSPQSRAAIGFTNYRDRNFYHCPLLVSAGPDGALGLGEPVSSLASERLGAVLDADSALDNITNRQRK